MSTITLDLVWDDGPPWWTRPEFLGKPEDLADVDFIRSEAGSWYEVLDSRKVASTVHPVRYRFTVRRLGRFKDPAKPAEARGMVRVIEFYWHPRSR